MEYVEGTDLGRLVRERGPLPVERACDYVRQAALGLQHAFEQGMVHRDLKPQNLMLTPDGRVRILDFGLACFASETADAAGLTSTGIVLGTIDYIAPEQADNAHHADIRSDIYSLGCTLYHLLAGQPPFPTGTSLQKVMAHKEKKPQPLTELRDDLPVELMPVVERMMAKDPKDRYQTPAAVAFALEPLLRATAVRTTDPGRTVVLDRIPVGERRRPRLAVATAILAFLVAGLLGVAVYRIATDKGELVITSDSDDVKVVITQGGKQVDVVDTKTDKQIRLALRSGEYELELKGAPEGLKLNITRVTLTRGKETLAKIEHREKKPAASVGDVRILVDRLVGHTEQPWKAAFLPDGKRVVSAGCDKVLRLWNAETGRELSRFEGHSDSILAVAVSPDGRMALSGGGGLRFPNHGKPGKDFAVRLWDLTSRRLIRRFVGHTHIVWCVAFSPDGRFALTGSMDHSMRLWNVANGNEVRRFPHNAWVMGVCFSPDGRWGLSSTENGDVVLWNLETGRDSNHFKGHAGAVESVAFSPDGRHALTGGGGDGDGVRLWDVRSGKEVRQLDKDGTLTIAFSPDGRRALTGHGHCTIKLWDVETGKELNRYGGFGGNVQCVAFSPDGRTALAVRHLNLAIHLWPLPDPPPAAGMVAWWRADGNAKDSAGGNHGTLKGGVTFAPGVAGQAFDFNGIDGEIDIGDARSLHLSSEDFSVSAWVNFRSLKHPHGTTDCGNQGDMSIVYKMADGNADGWALLKQDDNHFWFGFGGGNTNGLGGDASPTTIRSTTSVLPGVWYHVVAVKTAAHFFLYVNGIEEASKPLPAFKDTNTTNIFLGASAGNDCHMAGLIDEVAIYDRALSPEDVKARWRALAPAAGPAARQGEP
jgi:WD40 repeat protein